MKRIIACAIIGAISGGGCGAFTYWISGHDFTRCPDLAWAFVVTAILTLSFALLGGMVGSMLNHLEGGAK